MDVETGVVRLAGVGVPGTLLSAEEAFGGVDIGGLRCGTLVIRHGRVQRLEAEPGMTRPSRLILPGLVEAHVHLDKCHSIERCTDVGGDLRQPSRRSFGTRHSGRETTCAAGPRAACGADLRRAPWCAPTWIGARNGEPAATRGLGRAGRPGGGGPGARRHPATCGAHLHRRDDRPRPRAAEVARVVADTGGALGSFLLHHDGSR
jgi:imidazolonepropionase-like amidohydrolase